MPLFSLRMATIMVMGGVYNEGGPTSNGADLGLRLSS